MLSLAALAVIAGVLILALGGAQHDPQRHHPAIAAAGHGDIKLAAGYLGISTAELRRRLRSGQSLAEVAAGKGLSRQGLLGTLLSARAAAMRRRGLPRAEQRRELTASRTELLAELGHARRRSRELTAAAAYLGLDPAVLSSRLRSGKTLREIAGATAGRSPAGLIQVLESRRRRRLQAAAASHQITLREERAAIAALRARLTADVNRRDLTGPA